MEVLGVKVVVSCIVEEYVTLVVVGSSVVEMGASDEVIVAGVVGMVVDIVVVEVGGIVGLAMSSNGVSYNIQED